MATLLDIGLLEHFSIIFPFLLVFIVVYGTLLFLKPFGKETDKGICALIALASSSILLFSPSLVSLINFMAPWFVVLLVFIFFTLLLYRFAGASEESVIKVMSNWGAFHWFLLIILLIIVLVGLGQVYGPQLAGLSDGNVSGEINASQSSDTFGSNVWKIIFHPRVLGVVFMLIIASFVIRLMAGDS